MLSGEYIVGAIMRDVRVWKVSGGHLVAVLKTPIGQVKKVLVVNWDGSEEEKYEDVDRFQKQQVVWEG